MDYDIGEAFNAIENELIDSMMRNFSRHRAEELKEGFNWAQWQALQLKSLEQYRKANIKKFKGKFTSINNKMAQMIRTAHADGGAAEEAKILTAIKNGFNGATKPSGRQPAEFFKVNERKLNALIEATTNDMQKAETAVLRLANDQYRKIIYNAQVYANTGAGTYEKAVDMATKDFLSAGINCIVYKNGRRVNIKSYAEMALRTANKRAYLQGEGEKRQEWGVATVILNKRSNPCPLCAPFVGKVFIDDVWSGGSKDGVSNVTGVKYPLLSEAIHKGLYHPNCRDSHTTYFEGISTPPDGSEYTADELDALAENYKAEQKANQAERQAERMERLGKYSLDKDNKRAYTARAKQWRAKAEELNKSLEKPVAKQNNISQIKSDVTDLYKQRATPQKGIIRYGNGYNVSKHKNEIAVAKWLYDNFGGDITLLPEANKLNVKTPDFEWKGRLWELKNVTSEKSADSAIRNALKQIRDKPGGVILDYENNKISVDKLDEILKSRLKRVSIDCVDIMILLQEKTQVIIFRYKK